VFDLLGPGTEHIDCLALVPDRLLSLVCHEVVADLIDMELEIGLTASSKAQRIVAEAQSFDLIDIEYDFVGNYYSIDNQAFVVMLARI